MDNKQIEQRTRLANEIRALSHNKNITSGLFDLVLQCLCRTPLGSIAKIDHFLQMIKMLVENDMDYNLLLKAGILAGKFPDYQRYKRKQYEAILQYRERQVDRVELEKFQQKLLNTKKYTSLEIHNNTLIINIDVKWLDRLYHIISNGSDYGEKIEVQYKRIWRMVTQDCKEGVAKNLSPDKIDFNGNYLLLFEIECVKIRQNILEKEMGEIKKILNLNTKVWSYDTMNSPIRFAITLKKNLPPDEKIINVQENNPYDSIGISYTDNKSYVFYDTYESEAVEFISIFQDLMWSNWQQLIGIKGRLIRYFVQQKGREPDEKELNTLRRRFYRFIKKAYHEDAHKSISERYNDMLPQSHAVNCIEDYYTYTKKAKFIFYIGLKGFGHKKTASDYDAKLFYDKKKQKFFILRSSRLSIKIDASKDPGIKKFIENNSSNKAIIRIKDANDTFYRVLKKIEVKSPSKAAWLVCGYKRNGLKVWRNIYKKSGVLKTQTLQQVLEELKIKNTSSLHVNDEVE